MSKWFVICTRKGWEKKVEQLLLQKGFESYCPLVEEKRKWSDRVKSIAAPLFGSHIFVRIEEVQRPKVRMTPGVVNFIYTNGRPATVRKKVMDSLRQMLAENDTIKVFHLNSSQSTQSTEVMGLNERPVMAGPRVKKIIIHLGKNSYEVWASRPKLMFMP